MVQPSSFQPIYPASPGKQIAGHSPLKPNSFFRKTFFTPSPAPPTSKEFYREGLSTFTESYVNGSKKYFKSLKENPLKAISTLIFSASVGAGLTSLTKFKNLAHHSFLLALLGYPVLVANRTFPKFTEAYRMVQEGNPTQGRETMKKAMDDSVYHIMHEFFKPMSFAYLFAIAFSLPSVLARKPKDIMELAAKGVLKLLRAKPDHRFIKALDRQIYKPLTQRGQVFEDRLIRQSGALRWLSRHFS